ncbi:MAG: HAD family phosphatase [Deltaproteobacteria bacterium]|nr:HAD family phosphatase [Deltaproteobacteria bacterium]
MGIRAVLFDLDGTLVDSERANYESVARVLERDLGVVMTQAQREFVVGHSWNEIHALLVSEHEGLSIGMHELSARATEERERLVAEKGMPTLPGAVEAVRRLGARYPKAIVTGSSRAEAWHSLRLLGLTNDFQVVMASEDYARGKPAPDGYLMAASALGAAPKDCLVLEDSVSGIAAGRAAGMLVVAIRVGNFLGHDQSAAHYIVETLDDVTDSFLAAIEGSGA